MERPDYDTLINEIDELMNELNEAVDGEAKAIAASFTRGGSGDNERDAVGQAHDLLDQAIKNLRCTRNTRDFPPTNK